MRKGEGQEKGGPYYYQWTDAAGRRRKVRASSLEELREREKAASLDLLSGIATRKMTLNDAVAVWERDRRDSVAIGALKETTLVQYKRAYELHASEAVGGMPIDEITPGRLETFYKRELAKGYSASTVANVAKPINQALAIAEREGWIRRNPAIGSLDLVRRTGRRMQAERGMGVKALTAEQQGALTAWLDAAPGMEQTRWLVEFLLFTGLRVGELGGLQTSGVTGDSVTVSLSLAYYSVDGKMRRAVQAPKTAAGRRVVPLAWQAKRAYAGYRRWMAERGVEQREPVCGYSDFAFLTGDGWPLTSAMVNERLKDMVEAFNACQEAEGSPTRLPRISAHWLRRTFCTRLAEAGVSLVVAQRLMGHSSPTVTANVYTAVSEGFASRELGKLQDVMRGQ